MTKATYKRKQLIGVLLAVAKGDVMIIIVGSMQSGKQSTQVVAETTTKRGMWWQENLMAQPQWHIPPTRSHLMVLTKQFHQLGTKYSNISLLGHFYSNLYSQELCDIGDVWGETVAFSWPKFVFCFVFYS